MPFHIHMPVINKIKRKKSYDAFYCFKSTALQAKFAVLHHMLQKREVITAVVTDPILPEARKKEKNKEN